MATIYRNFYEKIFELAVAGSPKPAGGYYALAPGLILGHDPLIALLVDDFRELRRKMPRGVNGKCFFTADHFAPPSTIERAGILKKFLDFSAEEKIRTVKVFEGICHQLLVESPQARPFSFIIGSDSHTVTAGALASVAAGYGSMDILGALATGAVREKKYPVIGVRFTGKKKRFVTGRDIGLEIIARIGEGGAANRVLEYSDETAARIHIDDRFSVSNASVECGAFTGLFRPDAVLLEYLAKRDNRSVKELGRYFSDYASDVGAGFDSSLGIDLSGLNPRVALPHDFSDIRDVSRLRRGVALDQVFIGSCASGRLLDFKYMCDTLDALGTRYRKTAVKKAPRVRLIVTPSSKNIYLRAMRAGYLEKLVNFGAVITNPSCGPCGGIDKGILGENEVCLSTSTRNFRGRMGPFSSEIYIASPVTAILSAFTGKITPPEEVFK
ncbi:MAG: 3-isopropylmalate dehydratase [Elusimicrobia bacterium CG08_land_8_20_14_0_20_59_10]|nr:MAG: 3-isopropylmalate dehydratase [Elusimicrobia bacterium CG08_land_8_20_14_0_20_59_10]